MSVDAPPLRLDRNEFMSAKEFEQPLCRGVLARNWLCANRKVRETHALCVKFISRTGATSFTSFLLSPDKPKHARHPSTRARLASGRGGPATFLGSCRALSASARRQLPLSLPRFVHSSGRPRRALRRRAAWRSGRRCEGMTSRVKIVPRAMPATIGDADGISRGGAGAGDQRQREMAANGRDAGHENRAQPDERGLADGLRFWSGRGAGVRWQTGR